MTDRGKISAELQERYLHLCYIDCVYASLCSHMYTHVLISVLYRYVLDSLCSHHMHINLKLLTFVKIMEELQTCEK